MLLNSIIFVVLVAYVIHSATLNTDGHLPETGESSDEMNCTRLPGFMNISQFTGLPAARIVTPVNFDMGTCPPGCQPSTFGDHEILLINGENEQLETIIMQGFQVLACKPADVENDSDSGSIRVVTMSPDRD